MLPCVRLIQKSIQDARKSTYLSRLRYKKSENTRFVFSGHHSYHEQRQHEDIHVAYSFLVSGICCRSLSLLLQLLAH